MESSPQGGGSTHFTGSTEVDTVERARLPGREGPFDGCQQDGPRGMAPRGPEGGRMSPLACRLQLEGGEGQEGQAAASLGPSCRLKEKKKYMQPEG